MPTSSNPPWPTPGGSGRPVGSRWRIEHYISEVTRDVVRQYGPRARPQAAAGAPVAVACCVPRERHGLGLMMVADALRAGGVGVHLLGEGLPAAAVIEFVARVDAELLGLSCAMDIHLPEVADLIAGARRAVPGLKVAFGGAVLRDRGDAVRAGVGADWTARDVREVRRVLPDWLAALRRTPAM